MRLMVSDLESSDDDDEWKRGQGESPPTVVSAPRRPLDCYHQIHRHRAAWLKKIHFSLFI